VLRRIAWAKLAFLEMLAKQEFGFARIPNPLVVLTTIKTTGALRGIELAYFFIKNE